MENGIKAFGFLILFLAAIYGVRYGLAFAVAYLSRVPPELRMQHCAEKDAACSNKVQQTFITVHEYVSSLCTDGEDKDILNRVHESMNVIQDKYARGVYDYAWKHPLSRRIHAIGPTCTYPGDGAEFEDDYLTEENEWR